MGSYGLCDLIDTNILTTRSWNCCNNKKVNASPCFVTGYHAPGTEAAVQIQEIPVCSPHDCNREPERPFSQGSWQGKKHTNVGRLLGSHPSIEEQGICDQTEKFSNL